MAEEQEQATQSKGGSNKLMIILIAIIVLLVGALAAGGAWYFLSEDGARTDHSVAVRGPRQEAVYVKLRTKGGKPSFISNFYESSGRQRFMQIYVEALTRDPDVKSDLEKHMPLVVHSLNTLFAKQLYAEMQTTAGKRMLRQEATRVVQEILQQETGKPGVEAVFFTNFVMQ